MKFDHKIKEDIIEELRCDPSIDAASIGVSVTDGIATLTGNVSTFAAHYAVERIAKRVAGLRGVENSVMVTLGASDTRRDCDIAGAALHALNWDVSVPDNSITVTVNNGRIKLEGVVDWQYEREAAYNAVKNLTGARSVSNEIVLREKEVGKDIQQSIFLAFLRSAEVDAEQVQVIEADGEVTLEGQVRSLVEYDAAEKAAWASPGVTAVVNKLRVVPG